MGLPASLSQYSRRDSAILLKGIGPDKSATRMGSGEAAPFQGQFIQRPAPSLADCKTVRSSVVQTFMDCREQT